MSAKRKKGLRTVVLINPATCGIYKNGGTRYKVDHATGRRTEQIDNELGEHVAAYVAGKLPPGAVRVSIDSVFRKRLLVPRYYDARWLDDFNALLKAEDLTAVGLGVLVDSGVITILPGHGSPSNDMRAGHIPYIKVSDVRSLRVNVNPTNLVSRAVAESCWGGSESGLKGWDLLTPNRASSNIGEFAVLLPGEEERVLTKEFFVLRLAETAPAGWDWAYLLWALCLKAVRKQWQRVALMQTNREDVGDRWREILLPEPKSPKWAHDVSKPFREHFTTLVASADALQTAVRASGFEFIASVTSALPTVIAPDDDDGEEDQAAAVDGAP
jgi:type I restriction enzyme M protein